MRDHLKEAVFERAFMAKLKKLPNGFFPPKGAPGAILGNADRVGCLNGLYISLEFKRSAAELNKKTRRAALQKYTAELVDKAGGFSAFVYPENWEQIFAALERIARAKN